ncbi:hypothetical protein [Dactylosporangium sp. NPDC050588]|uniref:hypothetical protein n=1 Tax=Dactylosporangium sp. NPDC050588 TaxID=3157211 RepID=UPI0033FAF2B5
MDFEIQRLATSLDEMSPTGRATIFGLCARVLAPLVVEVERRCAGVWSFRDYAPALEVIETFALDAGPAGDHGELRASLAASVPNGHDLDGPWSTNVQAAIICADAGLAAASVDAQPESIWIEYALEPLTSSVQARDIALVRRLGYTAWLYRLPQDPAVAAALSFIQQCCRRILSGGPLTRREFTALVSEGNVLLPVRVD